MAIALFITFLFTNLLMIFVMKFVFTGNYSYNEGMLLGVHIPEKHVKDETVQSIICIARHRMNRALLVNLILGIAVCFTAFWNVAIFLFIYFFWITIFIFWVLSSNNISHRKMYALKIANNWINENQKRKVYIDTNVSAELGNFEISYKYHGYILLAEVICVMPFVIKHNEPVSTSLIIMGICSIAISLFSMFFHMYVNCHESAVYSADTAINQKVCQIMKKYKGAAMLLMSGINAVSWLYISTDTLIRCIVRAKNLPDNNSLGDDKLTVSAAGYSSEIYLDDIETVKLLDTLPDDHFTRTNGGDTEEYMVGHFKGRTYGKCELYLYTDNSPIILIQTRTDTLFVNSENSDQTKTLYKKLHAH